MSRATESERGAFTDADLSRLTWEAREVAAMYHNTVKARTGVNDEWTASVRDRLDAYRAERGWNPNGFGDE